MAVSDQPVTDRRALRELIEWHPPKGVLSVYVGVDPADRGEGWRIALRNSLREVVEGHPAHGDPPRADIKATAERVLDRFAEGPIPGGRSQIGFVEVGHRAGEERWSSLQYPACETAVQHAPRPYLRRLIEALEDSGRYGVAAVSWERVRLWGWHLGEIEEVDEWDLAVVRRGWRERKAPKSPDPARLQGTTAAGKDQFDQRLEAQRERFLKEAGRLLAEEASGRDWWDLLAFGDEHQLKILGEGLSGLSAHPVDHHNLTTEGSGDIAARIAELIDPLNRSREVALVRRIQDAAYSPGGRASVGASETLDALAESRVEHLAFDRDAEIGRRVAEHRLFGQRFASELGAGIDPLELVIEQALETSAKITPVKGAAAERLAENEGIAALLRY